MNILCVDDDPTILQFFIEMLKKLPLSHSEITAAMYGEQAIDIVTGRSIDLVILDLMLPDISGLEALRRIKELRPRIEVLVVTGYASAETAVAAMKAGARDYIEKPVDLVALREKMTAIINLIEREREAEEDRFAKELMEAGALRGITSPAEALVALRQYQTQIANILGSSASDAEKLQRIGEVIKNKFIA